MALVRRLPRVYFQSLDVTSLAKDLLGKYLVSQIGGNICSGKIIETEAYRGPDDRACHAYNNRITPRTEVMYEAGGVAYVYICYGMHHLMNVITGPRDHAHAVLIRALEPVDGLDIMADRRKLPFGDTRLTKGPGTLSKALGITSEHNGIMLYDRSSLIWIEDRGVKISSQEICSGPRIGVESAGEAALWPWRYFVKGNKYVSARKTCQ
jgi:DNA-3-methyladenine glycosylase